MLELYSGKAPKMLLGLNEMSDVCLASEVSVLKIFNRLICLKHLNTFTSQIFVGTKAESLDKRDPCVIREWFCRNMDYCVLE